LRRIKSVSSTKKITKALEMVSAAKMRKAIEAVLKTRAYASLSWETVLRLAKLAAANSESLHPLLKPRRQVNKAAIILLTGNRGMCGGYNTAVINKAKESIKKHPATTEFILAGKKGTALYHQGFNIAAEFEKSELLTDAREIYPIVKMVLSDYARKKYDKILVAYTDFVNPVKQVPRLRQLLPVNIENPEQYLGSIELKAAWEGGEEAEKGSRKVIGDVYEYVFEPSPREVLDKMIPRLLEVQLYQAFLEANASEHSARMTAMHQATDAATDMVSELTLFYNKARQAGITSEIAEISAGANALAE